VIRAGEQVAADPAFFAEHGWWIAPPLFDEATMVEARARAHAVCEGVHPTGEAPQIVYPVEDERHGLRKIDNAWWADDVIAAIVTNPEIGRLAAELIGAEEIHLWHDQLLWKPPGTGTPSANVGWHQDRGYWTASSSSSMLTAWVAFDDVTEDMGALRFVDGSHRWGPVIGGNAFFETDLDRSRQQAQVPEGEEWREVVAELATGQVSFHHCKTIHGSGPNVSDRHRRSVAIHLVSGEATVVAGRHHPNLELFDAEPGTPFRGPRFPRLWPVPA
jgi:ectoine hydroxylase-related dioxygenase (phytanoyl-CoA dioxygenase family)